MIYGRLSTNVELNYNHYVNLLLIRCRLRRW
jgi:hypothetical protein